MKSHTAVKSLERAHQHKHICSLITRATIPDLSKALADEVQPYALDELVSIKTSLNTQKSRLDIYHEMSARDGQVRKQMGELIGVFDTYKHLKFHIEKAAGAWPVTNAWMKYWEIYIEYDIVPNHVDHTFTAFFNAELPGASLCALNHYMKTMRPTMKFEWWASSLAPGESTGDGSALGDTYGLYAANRSRWLMSSTNNGDATVLDNLLDFERRVGPTVDLYSHDAGISVSDDFNNQELANAKLHLGCAIAGFMTLRIGGAFIAKQYTCFETFTWNLILIYSLMFDEFYLCKPLTSRPYNSEIYLVGKGFRGFDSEIRRVLIDRLADFHVGPCRLAPDCPPDLSKGLGPFIPSDAVSILWGEQSRQLRAFARAVFGQQAAFIAENVSFIEKFRQRPSTLRAALEGYKRGREKEWLKCYPVPKIAPQDNLKAAPRK
jgi:hypothetical protein